MNTFGACDLTQEDPPGICATCAAHGLVHNPTRVEFAHCEHNRTGAYRTPGANWRCFDDIDAADFKRSINAAVLMAETMYLETSTADGPAH